MTQPPEVIPVDDPEWCAACGQKHSKCVCFDWCPECAGHGTVRVAVNGGHESRPCPACRPAVARPDQGDGDGERCRCGHEVADHLGDTGEIGGCLSCESCWQWETAPAVDPAHGAEHVRCDNCSGIDPASCINATTPEAVLTDLRGAMVDGVGRAALVEAVREALAKKLTTWVIGVAHENAWNCADALIDGPLADVLAQAAADRAAVQRGLAVADDNEGGAA